MTFIKDNLQVKLRNLHTRRQKEKEKKTLNELKPKKINNFSAVFTDYFEMSKRISFSALIGIPEQNFKSFIFVKSIFFLKFQQKYKSYQ